MRARTRTSTRGGRHGRSDEERRALDESGSGAFGTKRSEQERRMRGNRRFEPDTAHARRHRTPTPTSLGPEFTLPERL